MFSCTLDLHAQSRITHRLIWCRALQRVPQQQDDRMLQLPQGLQCSRLVKLQSSSCICFSLLGDGSVNDDLVGVFFRWENKIWHHLLNDHAHKHQWNDCVVRWRLLTPVFVCSSYRGSQWERPGGSAPPTSDSQRADQQPDRQAQVLLHLQDLPTTASVSLQHLWQLRR